MGGRSDRALERVVLHVGLHKTGTTYLQKVMTENRGHLRRTGIWVPTSHRRTNFAFQDLIPWDSEIARDPRVPGAWQRLVDAAAGSGLPVAVISQERLSVAGLRQARRVVSSFGDTEVHVVVTVRDLTRVVASHWQEDVKSGATLTLDEYAARLRDPEAAGQAPARGFWMHEDVAEILRTWRAVVPADRMHVITVPPPDSPPELLISRFGSVAGFTLDDVPDREIWSNENIGAYGTELIRRLNERLGGRLRGKAYRWGVKLPLSRHLASLPDRRSAHLEPGQIEWAAATSARFADEIRAGGYQVVGDLADLAPRTPGSDGGGKEDVPPDDSELLDLALGALSTLAALHGEAATKADLKRGADRWSPSRRAKVRTRLGSWGYVTARLISRTASRTEPGRRAQATFLRRRRGR
jgi:hypothetical protein